MALPLFDDRARSVLRDAQERESVRTPRSLSDHVKSRLARYWRAMPSENVEIVRQALAANRSGPPDATTETVVALADPNCTFTSRLTAVEGAAYRGHDGIRQYFEDLADAFQEWTNESHAIEELRSDAVLTDSTFRGVGRSGVGVELRSALVWVLFDGKVIGLHAYGSREEALEAAGTSQ